VLDGRQWQDLAYADESEAQRLDLYLPAEGEGPFPLVVWIHGGGWQNGDENVAPGGFQKRVLDAGFALASVHYRLTDEASFPAQIHDVKTSIRWLRKNAKEFHLRRKWVGVWGSSAGAHLAALLATSAGVEALEGGHLGSQGYSSRVQAVVDWYGPTDLVGAVGDMEGLGCPLDLYVGPESPLEKFLGGPHEMRLDIAREASPVTYVSKDDPPFLIQHGTADCVVPLAQSLRLFQRIDERGAPSGTRLTTVDGAGHGGGPFRAEENVNAVVEFFRTHIH